MLSVLPMKVSLLVLVEPPEVVPPEVVPPEVVPPEVEPDEPDPDPPLTLVPPGRVRVEPLVENTTLPSWSVRYTEMPAEDRRLSASEVGCP